MPWRPRTSVHPTPTTAPTALLGDLARVIAFHAQEPQEALPRPYTVTTERVPALLRTIQTLGGVFEPTRRSWRISPRSVLAIQACGWEVQAVPLWQVRTSVVHIDPDFAGGDGRGLDIEVVIQELDARGSYSAWQCIKTARVVTDEWHPVLRALAPAQFGSADPVQEALDRLAECAGAWIAEGLPQVVVWDTALIRAAHAPLARRLTHLVLCPTLEGDMVRLERRANGRKVQRRAE